MTATSTGMTRLDSFPFTSHDDGYDAAGYPVYDRAVDSRVLRETFAKFFTNGVFPSPGTALQIGKASTGLAVTVQPGICIINGAMGGVNGDDPVTLTLDTAAPQGNTCYAVMLRFDNTDSFADSRSILLNVVRGDAGENPTPPTPDTSTPEVRELRLGYVTVPSGATDLSGATVTNEKGLAVCPYAAPFEDIDLSQVVSDAQAEASQALAALNDYIETNMSFVESAIDGTTAGNLQNQITALQQQLDNFDLSDSVDNETIEYTPAAGSAQDKLRVMLQETRAAMGLGDTLGALPVSSGGTGVTSIDSLSALLVSSVPATLTADGARWSAAPENGESVINFKAFFGMFFQSVTAFELVFATLTEGLAFGGSFHSAPNGTVYETTVPPTVSESSVSFSAYYQASSVLNECGVFLR